MFAISTIKPAASIRFNNVTILIFSVATFQFIRYTIDIPRITLSQKEASNTIYQIIHEELEIIHQKIEAIQEQLSNLPPGKLTVTQNQSRYKWYISNQNKQTYLPKSHKSLAEELAKKKYLSYKLEELLLEKKACTLYLQHFAKSSDKSEQLLANPRYFPLLESYFKPKSQTHDEWVHTMYSKNVNHPEHLIHKSLSTNLVRSKSEAMIDTALFQNKIPYRYECLLQLGDLPFFPDFTILHPITNQIYYWEHFGMMDNPAYAKNAFSKLQIYCSNNIIPSINLITTYETRNAPLNIYQIESIIHYYFT